jgi:hypothetical protein
LLGLFRQRGFLHSTIHQAYPSITDSLIYRKPRMPCAEAGMTSLFDVCLRPSEPTDQEISEAPLGTWKIAGRVHGPQKVVLRDLPIKGGDQPCETVRTNDGKNFKFLHFFLLSKCSCHFFYQLRWIGRRFKQTQRSVSG